ncbi:MAG: hypothetical protein HYY02_09940 [Chloroflexi bacterium]|nr:hypothetical protein [Chloroflexota bacterium]
MPGTKPILLATSNPAKAAKLRWLLKGLPFAPVLLSDRPDLPPAPEETGATFEENARQKAAHASAAFGGLAIASDGGVRIPALGAGWDPLLTRRAAGEEASDADRAGRLLLLMEGLRGEERRVLWAEAIAVADRGRLLAAWEEAGTEGLLTETYDPANAIPGFWVYSLWWFPQLGKRYVDLTPQELEQADVTWGRLKERVRGWFKIEGESKQT